MQKTLDCILFGIFKSSSITYQVYFFFQDKLYITPPEALADGALNIYLPTWFWEAVTDQYNQAKIIITEKFDRQKYQRIKKSKFLKSKSQSV